MMSEFSVSVKKNTRQRQSQRKRGRGRETRIRTTSREKGREREIRGWVGWLLSRTSEDQRTIDVIKEDIQDEEKILDLFILFSYVVHARTCACIIFSSRIRRCR